MIEVAFNSCFVSDNVALWALLLNEFFALLDEILCWQIVWILVFIFPQYLHSLG